jgi:hypothetical protein
MFNNEIGRQASGVAFWAIVLFGFGKIVILAILNLYGKQTALKLLVTSAANVLCKSLPHVLSNPVGMLSFPNAFQDLVLFMIFFISSFITR